MSGVTLKSESDSVPGVSGRSVAFACPACGRAVEGAVASTMTCAACGSATSLEAAGIATGKVDRCPVCGSGDLYAQRDFHRGLGLLLAAVGLGLGPFTHWISVGVAVLADAALYRFVPDVVVCYACNAQIRHVAKPDLPKPFDIAVHDAYKFGKRFPPRRERAVAGPLAKRLRREGRAT